MADSLLPSVGCNLVDDTRTEVVSADCGGTHDAVQVDPSSPVKQNVYLMATEPIENRCTPRRSPRLMSKQAGAVPNNMSHTLECNPENIVVEPVVGMVFKSMAEVEKFYKSYAKAVGFGVIRPQGSYRTGKERRATTWKCSCSGDPDAPAKRRLKKLSKGATDHLNNENDVGFPRRRKSKKCFCKAKLYASLNPVNEWVIRNVVLEHSNHTPKPIAAKMVKEYRMHALTDSIKRRILSDYHAGVPVSKIINCIAHESGGFQNLCFTEADIRHVVHEHRRLKMQGGDTNALISYFDKMRRDNPSFYHTHRLDSEGYMKDIFWVDPRSIAAYEEFSDVVCFDTTYLTNQYALPFANFVGVNHHGQSILFGCALISNEDSETFEWVFRQWLDCMKGVAPGGLLTDQAAAMRKPIEDVMPHTKHRWCIWHILQKLPYKLGYHEKYSDIKDAILDAVYNSLGTIDFEVRWQEVVAKFELDSNEWLNHLFAEQHMWVPCFMTDHFWAGMRSTQRCESINSFFDQFLTRDTPFCEFGEKYVQAVEKRIFQENQADLNCEVLKQYLCTAYSLERLFRDLYTTEIFKRFQQECQKMTYVMVDGEFNVDSENVKFVIQDRVWVKGKEQDIWKVTDKRTTYCVDFNVSTREATCNCFKLQTEGIMCRHLVRVYDKLQVDEIPPCYILRRWRKDVERKHKSVNVAYHDLSRTKEKQRLHSMDIASQPIFEVASKSEEDTQIVLAGLQRIDEELRGNSLKQQNSNNTPSFAHSNVDSANVQSSIPTPSENMSHDSGGIRTRNSSCTHNTQEVVGTGTPSSFNSITHVIKDPHIPKKRGRPRGTRYKSSFETGWYSSRKTVSEEVKKKRGRPPKVIGSKCDGTSGKCVIDTQLKNGGAVAVDHTVDKIQVKRRKTVSFAVNLGDTQTIGLEDDDFFCRNELSFDDIDPDLNLS